MSRMQMGHSPGAAKIDLERATVKTIVKKLV